MKFDSRPRFSGCYFSLWSLLYLFLARNQVRELRYLTSRSPWAKFGRPFFISLIRHVEASACSVHGHILDFSPRSKGLKSRGAVLQAKSRR